MPKDPWKPAYTVDEAQALLRRCLFEDSSETFDPVALEESVTHWLELYQVANSGAVLAKLATWRTTDEGELPRMLLTLMLLAMNVTRHLVPANDS